MTLFQKNIVSTLILITSMSSIALANTENEGEAKGFEIGISKVHAQVEPDFEIAFPNGVIRQNFKESFGKIDTRFTLGYDFFENSIDGSLKFSRPMKRIIPGIRFFLGVDFENLIRPEIDEDDIILVPEDEYISRKRGAELSVKIPLGSYLKFTTDFTVNDTVKGKVSDGFIIDEGVDLIQGNSITYNGMRVREDARGADPEGNYFSSVLAMSFRNSLSTPVSLDHRNNFLNHSQFLQRLYLTAEVTCNYPINIWEKSLAGFYSLGGYNSLRGASSNSVNAFRFLLISSDFEYEFSGMSVDIPELFNTDLMLTKIRAILLIDELLTQEHYDLHSEINNYTSIGGGISFTFAEKDKKHYVLKLFIAQALKRNSDPVLYFTISSSKFKYRTSSQVF